MSPWGARFFHLLHFHLLHRACEAYVHDASSCIESFWDGGPVADELYHWMYLRKTISGFLQNKKAQNEEGTKHKAQNITRNNITCNEEPNHINPKQHGSLLLLGRRL